MPQDPGIKGAAEAEVCGYLLQRKARGPYGEAKIRLKPVHRVYRHQEFALRGERKDATEEILREFIDRGWLEPCHSEWASTCFVVPKKVAEGRRLVVDYRGLNAQTQHDSYTLPLIEDMLPKEFCRRNSQCARPETWL